MSEIDHRAGRQRRGLHWPWILVGLFVVAGLANGLLPCGLVYAALSIPVVMADPAAGAAAMVAFGMGTVPALAAVTLGLRQVLEMVKEK